MGESQKGQKKVVGEENEVVEGEGQRYRRRETDICVFIISIKAHRFRMRRGSEREVDRPCNSEEET